MCDARFFAEWELFQVEAGLGHGVVEASVPAVALV